MVNIRKKVLGKIYQITINVIPCTHKSKLNILKRFILKRVFRHIGENVNIRPKIKFANGYNISLGDKSGVGEGSFLQDVAQINIGNNVLMGDECFILTVNHEFKKEKLIIEQSCKSMPVNIGDDVWIGARVTILPGVTIGKGVVIGAGSIVTKDIEEYTIVAGVPARKIGNRE